MNPTAQAVDRAFYVIGGISLFFLVLITFLMIYFALRYRRSKHPEPVQVEGNTTLEIVWTIIPTLLVLVMFWYGYKGFLVLRTPPKDALKIEVLGRMWEWQFTYPNGKKSKVLYVPKGKPILLDLKSVDVIHSFYIPAFRIKEDVVPGQKNYLWFKPTALGPADIFCAEYCGVKHAFMLSRVEVMEPEAFQRWLGEEKKEEGNLKEKALKILEDQGCLSCHSLDGTEELAPTFQGLGGRTQTVLINGKEKTVQVDKDYIRQSILEPSHAIVKGFDDIMPEGELSKEELETIVNFLAQAP